MNEDGSKAASWYMLRMQCPALTEGATLGVASVAPTPLFLGAAPSGGFMLLVRPVTVPERGAAEAQAEAGVRSELGGATCSEGRSGKVVRRR